MLVLTIRLAVIRVSFFYVTGPYGSKALLQGHIAAMIKCKKGWCSVVLTDYVRWPGE
jgi:hypothetical protein